MMIMSAPLQPFFSAFFACLYVMVVDSANRAAQKLIRGTGSEEGREGGLVIGVTMIFLRWGWTVHRILAKSSMTLFLVMAEDKLHSRQEVRQHVCGDSFVVLSKL